MTLMQLDLGEDGYRGLAFWRDHLDRQLDDQAARAERYAAYYDGDFPMNTLMSQEERRVFVKLLEDADCNWCELVVNAVAERLAIVGFRFGGESGDDLAWHIWQSNQLDADSELAQTDSLVSGHSFVSVQPDDDNPSGVSIVGEHATEVTVAYRPGSRRQRLASYKRFTDPLSEVSYAILQLPQLVAIWGRDEQAGLWPVEPWEIRPNPMGVVSVVELTPQPRTIGYPRSELKPVLPIQDRINVTLFNRLVATDYGAFRQIWATGLALERDGEGKPKKPFDVGANRLLVNENPEGRFGMLAGADLRGYLDAVAADVQHLAAITQTPPHYLLGQMINIPASGMKAAETGLVAKVRRRASHLGEGWEEVMRLAFTAIGDARAADPAAEVIWRDFESRSEGELVDALVKMRTLGVPLEVLWERWGASPQAVQRWKELAAEEDRIAAQQAAEQAAAIAQEANP